MFNDKQSQFELFPGSSEFFLEPGKPHARIKNLTLSVENIIVLSIILLMSFVLLFSFGVEHGKKLARKIDGRGINGQNRATLDKAKFHKIEENSNEALKETAVLERTVDSKNAGEQKIFEVPVEIKIMAEDYYTVQVASFKSKTRAQKEADSLQNVGHDTFVVPKGSYSIVCVGKFPLQAEAKKFSKHLRTRYQDLLVRRL